MSQQRPITHDIHTSFYYYADFVKKMLFKLDLPFYLGTFFSQSFLNCDIENGDLKKFRTEQKEKLHCTVVWFL